MTIRSYIKNILVNNEYIISNINGIETIIVQNKIEKKLNSELLMIVGNAFGFDCSLYYLQNENELIFEKDNICNNLQLGSESFNQYLKVVPIPWVCDNTVEKHCLLKDSFLKGVIQYINTGGISSNFKYKNLFDNNGKKKLKTQIKT